MTIAEEEEEEQLSDAEEVSDQKQFSPALEQYEIDKNVEFHDLQYLNIYDLFQRKEFLQNIYGT